MSKYIFLVSRLGSYIIDYIPFLAISYALGGYGVLGYLASILLLFLFRYITTSYFGATPGMMLLKLKLKNHNFKTCLKREVYRAGAALFFIGYIYGIFDKKGRCTHDIASNTYVIYKGSDDELPKRNKYILLGSNILLIIAFLRFTSSFLINDIGLVGLKRISTSDEYYQNFDGDNLVSISQQELYMKTLGRKYTALIDINGEPSIVRISNKLTYTEVYKLFIYGKRMIGQHIYDVNMPIQFISSGRFRGKRELCGLSPKNNLMLIDEDGNIYSNGKVTLSNPITLKCGDIDNDKRDEIVVLSRDGYVEVFKYDGKSLVRAFSGKAGEDIIPETFYIDKGITIIGENNDKNIAYFYFFKNNRFYFKNKKYFGEKGIAEILKFNDGVIVSNVFRNNMTFKIGDIQRLEVYSIKDRFHRIYNFGNRPARRYGYLVRTLEGVYDINGDGKDEIVLKAVGKQDVMGQGYIVEIYSMGKTGLLFNRILSYVEGLFNW